jgi:hypothetical protein
VSVNNFSPWLALVVGILIGWLGGWLIDARFERRRGRDVRGAMREPATPASEAGVTVQDGLAAAALVSDGAPVATPAVEEEPLPVIRYAPVRTPPDGPLTEDANTASPLDLPGVEQEDLSVPHSFNEEIAPEAPGELTGADEV